MRGGDKEPGLPEALRKLAFMVGIHKGKQQGQRDSFNRLFPQGLDEG